MLIVWVVCTGGKWASEVAQIRVDRFTLLRPCPGSKMTRTGQAWGGGKQRPNFLWGLVIGVSGVSGVGGPTPFNYFQSPVGSSWIKLGQVGSSVRMLTVLDADKRCKLIAAVTILDPIAVHLVATPRHPNFSGWKPWRDLVFSI